MPVLKSRVGNYELIQVDSRIRWNNGQLSVYTTYVEEMCVPDTTCQLRPPGAFSIMLNGTEVARGDGNFEFDDVKSIGHCECQEGEMNSYYNIQTRRIFCAPPPPFLQERRESGMASNRQNTTVEDLRECDSFPSLYRLRLRYISPPTPNLQTCLMAVREKREHS
eukprot:scaffold13807_cov78-Skeletonema_dohrnii-CCMP3373.AAC.1